MLPVWKAIRVGFVEMDWSQVTEKMRRRAKGAVGKNVDRLLGMAAGCLASAAAVLGHHDGGDSAIGLGAALVQLRQHIDRDAAKWERGRDRRYSALRYSSKVNVIPYANPFGGPAFLPGGTYVSA
jgi:steroid 5-alpha reductase family enzyme